MKNYISPNYQDKMSVINQSYLNDYLDIKMNWNKDEILEIIGLITWGEIMYARDYKPKTLKEYLLPQS